LYLLKRFLFIGSRHPPVYAERLSGICNAARNIVKFAIRQQGSSPMDAQHRHVSPILDWLIAHNERFKSILFHHS
jgi:hypothetical protein